MISSNELSTSQNETTTTQHDGKINSQETENEDKNSIILTWVTGHIKVYIRIFLFCNKVCSSHPVKFT